MRLFSLQTIWSFGFFKSGYWKIHSYLPSSLRIKLDGLILRTSADKNQLKKLELLGEKIGLNEKEVVAAYNPPFNMTHWRSRLTLFTTCVLILAVFVVSFLLFTLGTINNPPSTYAWGTRYGTIKPQDFNQRHYSS